MFKKHLIAGLTFAGLSLAASQSFAEGDAAKGETVFKKCGACHSIEPGKRKVGPSLHGVVGRTAGTLDGFNYSKVMSESGIAWDDESLDGYLADPRGYMPGTKMAFPGLKDEQDRADLIAYLKTLTE